MTDPRVEICSVSPVGIGGTAVIAVTRQSFRVSIPEKDRNVCLPHSVQTGSGTLSVGTGGFPWG